MGIQNPRFRQIEHGNQLSRFQLPVSAADRNFGVFPHHCSQKHFRHIRRDAVIAVHEAQIVAPGNIQPGISGPGQSGVFLMDHPDPGILGGVSIADPAAAVGTAVVHQNHFQIPVGLGQHGVDTPRKQGFDFIDWNDDTDQRFHRYLHQQVYRSDCAEQSSRSAQ